MMAYELTNLYNHSYHFPIATRTYLTLSNIFIDHLLPICILQIHTSRRSETCWVVVSNSAELTQLSDIQIKSTCKIGFGQYSTMDLVISFFISSFIFLNALFNK